MTKVNDYEAYNMQYYVLIRKVIKVTPYTIAKYLNYVRPQPSEIDYPRPEFQSKALLGDYAKDMYETFEQFDGQFVQICMTGDYRTLNKIIHYNVYDLT